MRHLPVALAVLQLTACADTAPVGVDPRESPETEQSSLCGALGDRAHKIMTLRQAGWSRAKIEQHVAGLDTEGDSATSVALDLTSARIVDSAFQISVQRTQKEKHEQASRFGKLYKTICSNQALRGT